MTTKAKTRKAVEETAEVELERDARAYAGAYVFHLMDDLRDLRRAHDRHWLTVAPHRDGLAAMCAERERLVLRIAELGADMPEGVLRAED